MAEFDGSQSAQPQWEITWPLPIHSDVLSTVKGTLQRQMRFNELTKDFSEFLPTMTTLWENIGSALDDESFPWSPGAVSRESV